MLGPHFDSRQVASITWACAMGGLQVHLPPLEELPAQQVALLADSVRSPCVEESLMRFTTILQRALVDPKAFAEALRQIKADHLGDRGSQLLLESQGISVEMDLPKLHNGRVLVRASCDFDLHLNRELKGSHEALAGVSPEGFGANEWLIPVPLPHSSLVDRSLCAEFQVLARLLDLLGLPDASAQGTVHVRVTATPCLSCISVLCQFQRLFPQVHLRITWQSHSKAIEKGLKTAPKWP